SIWRVFPCQKFSYFFGSGKNPDEFGTVFAVSRFIVRKYGVSTPHYQKIYSKNCTFMPKICNNSNKNIIFAQILKKYIHRYYGTH
ncbi:MAG: hypothetical protein IJ140_04495, partial [Prevotella sp.]|nr:hypothetical protein [Prevotella sp.]